MLIEGNIGQNVLFVLAARVNNLFMSTCPDKAPCVWGLKMAYCREARELYLGTSVPELHSAPSPLEFYRLVDPPNSSHTYLCSETGSPPTFHW